MQSYSRSVAVFRVSRVWKGHITRNYEMPAMESAELCDGFVPRLLVAGNELIVYARGVQSVWGDYVYLPLHCQTRLAKDAKADFRQLDRGHKPPRRVVVPNQHNIGPLPPGTDGIIIHKDE